MKGRDLTPASHRKIVDILRSERAELQGKVDRLTRENAALRRALGKAQGDGAVEAPPTTNPKLEARP